MRNFVHFPVLSLQPRDLDEQEHWIRWELHAMRGRALFHVTRGRECALRVWRAAIQPTRELQL